MCRRHPRVKQAWETHAPAFCKSQSSPEPVCTALGGLRPAWHCCRGNTVRCQGCRMALAPHHSLQHRVLSQELPMAPQAGHLQPGPLAHAYMCGCSPRASASQTVGIHPRAATAQSTPQPSWYLPAALRGSMLRCAFTHMPFCTLPVQPQASKLICHST